MKTRVIHGFAGTMILTSLLLGIFVPKLVWLTGFVGANLFQNAFTNWCLLSTILEKLGLKRKKDTCCN
jgi:hypothetical protein